MAPRRPICAQQQRRRRRRQRRNSPCARRRRAARTSDRLLRRSVKFVVPVIALAGYSPPNLRAAIVPQALAVVVSQCPRCWRSDDADHHLGRIVVPARPAERRDDGLDRGLRRPTTSATTARSTDRTGRAACLRRPAACAARSRAVAAQRIGVGKARTSCRARPDSRPASRSACPAADADLSEHRRRRRAGAGQRVERVQPLQADVAIILVPQATVEHRLHRLDHLGLARHREAASRRRWSVDRT